jgi:hypothetical protein
MKNRKLSVISEEELEKKNTKALLSYLNKLHRCVESFSKSDMEIDPDLIETDNIYFKQTEKWKTAYKTVKSILETREHVKK